MKPRLFVYGTLRRSHPAIHRRLLGDARLLGHGSISGSLYDLGEYPGVRRSSHEPSRVSGELYELSGEDAESRLDAIDAYEGDEFERIRVMVRLRNGRRRLAWAYQLADPPPERARRIGSGSYRRSAQRRVA